MNWPFLTPGLDATGLPSSATNAEIQQMWQEGGPSTSAGMIVWAAAAPDVVTYPGIALCIWGKTSGGVPTGEFYTYNGTTWTAMKVVPGSITGDSFADGSIAITKLMPGTALYVPHTNAAGDGVEWVSVATLIPNGTITAAMLANAANTGYILRSGTGGVYAPVLFSTALAAGTIEVAQVKDTLGGVGTNQVAYFPTKDAAMTFGYVEDLLRDNMTPTSKLKFADGLKGKWLKVNAAGTDLDGATASLDVAVFSDTQASGTAPQTITGLAAAATLRMTAEGTLPTGISIATDEITLTAGTYIIEAAVPLYCAGSASTGYIAWVEGGVVKKTANINVTIDGDYDKVMLYYKATIAATTVCKLVCYTAATCTVGKANSIAAISEVYTQVKITRL